MARSLEWTRHDVAQNHFCLYFQFLYFLLLSVWHHYRYHDTSSLGLFFKKNNFNQNDIKSSVIMIMISNIIFKYKQRTVINFK